jgi:hypothetical protein
MAPVFLTWHDEGLTRWVELADDKPSTIGRAPTCTVALGAQHTSVSREHALITRENGKYVIKHRSLVNPTLVNGHTVERDHPATLQDGNRVDVGGVPLIFHDLSAVDRTSGWICSTCQHENRATDYECWFDGTSRAYADTMVSVWHPAICRVITERKDRTDVHNLYAGDALAVFSDGQKILGEHDQLPANALARIELRESRPILRVVAAQAAMSLNSKAVVDEQRLSSGDLLVVGDDHLLILVRPLARR